MKVQGSLQSLKKSGLERSLRKKGGVASWKEWKENRKKLGERSVLKDRQSHSLASELADDPVRTGFSSVTSKEPSLTVTSTSLG